MTTDYNNHPLYPGARWWKFDLHAHTPESCDYGKGPNQSSFKLLKPRDWLLGYMRASVDCVAVTDHNTGDWIDKLKKALGELEQEVHPEFRRLFLFPGIELSVNGGFHLLAIFDTNKGTSDLDTLIGAVGYEGSKGDSDGVTSKSAIDVVNIVVKSGGIPIPAHVDHRKGLLQVTQRGSRKTVLDAETVNTILNCQRVLAMEVMDANFEKPEIYEQRKLAWTEVLGSDSHHPAGGMGEHFPGSHYTWVKMARPSIEGLRLALLDGGDFSIRRSDESDSFDPYALPTHRIESIEVAEARYMGRGQRSARLDFNPALNALVGGRGTGKSTVIHALRLAARRESDLKALPARSAPRETFERFSKVPSDQTKDGGLTPSTRIQWTFMRDGVRHRVHWRQDGTGTTVEDETATGEWTPSDAQAVTPDRFPLQVFSQGQIAELAGDDPAALLREIDRAAGVAAQRGSLNDAVAAFVSSRARIRELDSKLIGLEDSTTIELEDMERKLKRFEATGHTAILTAYRRRERQRRELNRQFDALEEAAQRIEATAASLELEDLPDGLFDQDSEEDRLVVDSVNTLRAALDGVAQDTKDVAQRLRRLVQSRRDALEQSEWQASVEETANEYRRLDKVLEAEGVADPNEYGSLVQARQRLESEAKSLQWDKKQRDNLETESQERLERVAEHRRAITSARRKFLADALAENKFVRIEIRPYGDDPAIIERSLRETLGVLDGRFTDDILATSDEAPPTGLVADLLHELPEETDARASEVERRLRKLKDRFASACKGQANFGGRFNNFLKREFSRSPDFLDRLLSWLPEDGLSVTYSRTGDGTDFQPISQASAGQRSAAMLAFLLAHGDEPLVLDQPEDDLDNHLIYDLVVRQIQENKHRRQIIVVTHNPNIVVNGDAEMLHAMAFNRGQCVVKQSGSLQEEAIREEVCAVMEGGREAFRRRYRRLEWEPTSV